MESRNPDITDPSPLVQLLYVELNTIKRSVSARQKTRRRYMRKFLQFTTIIYDIPHKMKSITYLNKIKIGSVIKSLLAFGLDWYELVFV